MSSDFKLDGGQTYGTVYSYDGEAGIIINSNNEFIFNNKDLQNDVNVGDIVSFTINTISFGNEKIQVARFVEGLVKGANKTEDIKEVKHYKLKPIIKKDEML